MPEGTGKRIGSGLVWASATAVLAVYIAGYQRTRSAADRFAHQVAERRVAGVASRRVRSVEEGLRWHDSPAAPATPAPSLPADAAVSKPAVAWKDGTYTGWGFSPHGNIEATVVITGGRIASAVISQCRTRYSCGVIGTLPPEVAERQSADVDYVSGATQSADAFYEAVIAALHKAG
jgi:uncharacterized protein with FMN-binding domain